MNQMYDVAYVRGLEKRIRELETNLRDWQINGVKFDPGRKAGACSAAGRPVGSLCGRRGADSTGQA